MRDDRAPEVMRHVAANVRRHRLRRGLTQEKLAEESDLDLTYVQRVERGTANASIRVIVALADALDVPIGSLFRLAVLKPPQRGRPRS